MAAASCCLIWPRRPQLLCLCFFFFLDTVTTAIYTLSLHDALPIFQRRRSLDDALLGAAVIPALVRRMTAAPRRSEEHTSELQSRQYLVCRLLLEKKKKIAT